MTAVSTDIDIDFSDRTKALAGLPHTPATLLRPDGTADRHNSGIYLQDVPVDPVSGLCSIGHKAAAALGYFKIDFLNVSIYAQVRDEAHLLDLLHREPYWGLLDTREVVDMLAHIHGYYGIVQTIRPRSIEDLAVVLALIRPGKRHLIGRPRTEIDRLIWQLDEGDGYVFRKAHAIAYAAAIVVQLNLISEQCATAPSDTFII